MTAVAHRGPAAPHVSVPIAAACEATTVVLRGRRPGPPSGPPAPRPAPTAAPRPPAHDAAGPRTPARHAAGVRPGPSPTGLGYPPPTAYPAIPVAPDAARVPAGLNAPLSGIFPVEIPPSSGFPLLDRALAHGRWLLACEPETRGVHRAGRGR